MATKIRSGMAAGSLTASRRKANENTSPALQGAEKWRPSAEIRAIWRRSAAGLQRRAHRVGRAIDELGREVDEFRIAVDASLKGDQFRGAQRPSPPRDHPLDQALATVDLCADREQNSVEGAGVGSAFGRCSSQPATITGQ